MSEMDNRLVYFTENHLEKLFYFCLRKTGNEHSAEDLTQDISLAVMTELRRGVDPDNFAAWVWQIARNRYAKWAASKHKRAELETGSDIEDHEIADELTPENEYVHREEISLLRRELAFISSEYRNVVVAYYIEDKSVGEIAKALALPVGTVKSKLFRARNILKEGMNMAREFGALSYKPENIAFINNGIGGSLGEPWAITNHSLYKNIMLAAYRTPSTAEELAIELGIALPYMEDELEFLVQSTLMKKNGNKYETNFFIVSAAAQEKVYEHLAKIAPELTKAIIDLLDYVAKCRDENSFRWHGGYQSFEDMKWMLLMRYVDRVNFAVLPDKEYPQTKLGHWGHTIRPNGGEWDILGLESYHGNMPHFVGQHGCASTDEEARKEPIAFSQYKYQYKQIERQTPVQLSYKEAYALKQAAIGKNGEIDPAKLEKLCEYGYICKTDAGYVPKLAVLYTDNMFKGLTDSQKIEMNRLCKTAEELAKGHYDFCRELIYREIPDFMKEDQYQIDHACANIFTMRGAVLEEALRTDYISYGGGETEAKDRMLGAYIVV